MLVARTGYVNINAALSKFLQLGLGMNHCVNIAFDEESQQYFLCHWPMGQKDMPKTSRKNSESNAYAFHSIGTCIGILRKEGAGEEQSSVSFYVKPTPLFDESVRGIGEPTLYAMKRVRNRNGANPEIAEGAINAEIENSAGDSTEGTQQNGSQVDDERLKGQGFADELNEAIPEGKGGKQRAGRDLSLSQELGDKEKMDLESVDENWGRKVSPKVAASGNGSQNQNTDSKENGQKIPLLTDSAFVDGTTKKTIGRPRKDSSRWPKGADPMDFKKPKTGTATKGTEPKVETGAKGAKGKKVAA